MNTGSTRSRTRALARHSSNRKDAIAREIKDDLIRISQGPYPGDLYGLNKVNSQQLMRNNGRLRSSPKKRYPRSFIATFFDVLVKVISVLITVSLVTVVFFTIYQIVMNIPDDPVIIFMISVVIIGSGFLMCPLMVSLWHVLQVDSKVPTSTGYSAVISSYMREIDGLDHEDYHSWYHYETATNMIRDLNVHEVPASPDDPEWNRNIDDIAGVLVLLENAIKNARAR